MVHIKKKKKKKDLGFNVEQIWIQVLALSLINHILRTNHLIYVDLIYLLWRRDDRNNCTYLIQACCCCCCCFLDASIMSDPVWHHGLKPARNFMEFSRQEYWSGLPCPPPENFPNPGNRTQVSCICWWIIYKWATREAPNSVLVTSKRIRHVSRLNQDLSITNAIIRVRSCYHSLSWGVKVKVLVTQSCPTLCDPLDCVAHQSPLSVGFPRQENWSELPCPSPGDLPNPGTQLGFPACAGGVLTTELPGRPMTLYTSGIIQPTELIQSHNYVCSSGTPYYSTRVSRVAQMVKNLLQCGRPRFDPWVG